MISLNLTIHNKDFLLNSVLEGIKLNTVGPYELVCVLDGCTDKSEEILDKFIKENKSTSIIKTEAPNVFETKANNIAASLSSGNYIIIIQDDMIINEKEWNGRLLFPFQSYSDVFAVTARMSHNWEFNPKSEHVKEITHRNDKWSDILQVANIADKGNLGRDMFGIRNCVNRGPLAIRHDVFKTMGGFDELFCPQDMDDHDFCYRTFKKTGMKCGCYPIDFLSRDEWGGTRINGFPASWLLQANQKNVKIVWERHMDLIEDKLIPNENRKLIFR